MAIFHLHGNKNLAFFISLVHNMPRTAPLEVVYKQKIAEPKG